MDKDKAAILQGTLDLLVLKTVETMGPLHGWAIAKRIEQISEDLLEMKYGTLYPALMRLEQSGWISSEWGTSDNNRRARFYSITRQGRKQLALEAEGWQQMAAFITRMLRSAREGIYVQANSYADEENPHAHVPFAGFETLRAVPAA